MPVTTKCVATGFLLVALVCGSGAAIGGDDDASRSEAAQLQQRIEGLVREAKAAKAEGWETLAEALDKRIEVLEQRLRALRAAEAADRAAREAEGEVEEAVEDAVRGVLRLVLKPGRVEVVEVEGDDEDEAEEELHEVITGVLRLLTEPGDADVAAEHTDPTLRSLRRALGALLRADRAESARIVAQAIQAMEALTAGRDDPEAEQALVDAPSADAVARVLTQAAELLEEVGREQSAREVRRLARTMKSTGAQIVVELQEERGDAPAPEQVEPAHRDAAARLLALEAKAAALEQVAKELRQEIRNLRKSMDE